MTDKAPAKRAGFPLRLDRIGRVAGPGSSGARLSTDPVAAAVRQVLRPQALLQHAAAVAARPDQPSGAGLDSAGVRERMVERLCRGGLHDPRVAAALTAVPRHLFVDTALIAQAYEDTSLPIGHGQTISKPSVVARMIELLLGGTTAAARGDLGRVLEIGSGCGYQAAVLGQLASRLISIERVEPLHQRARDNLDRIGEVRQRIRLVLADGMLGHPPNAPYDSIIAAAGGGALPQAWLDQLAIGGRLVAPVEQSAGRQSLLVVDRAADGYRRSVHGPVHFVPLKSGLVR